MRVFVHLHPIISLLASEIFATLIPTIKTNMTLKDNETGAQDTLDCWQTQLIHTCKFTLLFKILKEKRTFIN